jgi:DNA topoisomerase I
VQILPKSLVIVESPAKAKTINKFLGKKFSVKASVGHVRDLPKSQLGVDEEHDFAPTYTVLKDKTKVVAELKKAAQAAKDVYLACDPDREGEAIAWHLAAVLPKKITLYRVLFNEITKNAIEKAIARPQAIDLNKVNAQQARRILDRIVGYKLSPLLWDKVRRGLSAGRVQSVALKMVCDRETEIEAFVPEEYWTFAARLAAGEPPEFLARLARIDGKKARVATEQEARGIEAAVRQGRFRVGSVEKKESRRNPVPPFITSKLQQAAFARHRLPVRRTMQIAQGLYEGKDLGALGTVGLITYMRTDSTRVAEEALTEVRAYIGKSYGADAVPDKPNFYRSKKNVQDAHEAIRPTSLEYSPEQVAPHLTRDELNVYRMIWERFVASQMKPAVFDVTDVAIENGAYEFRAQGRVLKSPGFLAAFGQTAFEDAEGEAEDGGMLPPLSSGDALDLRDLETKQNFTQPPPRYTEATLVKALEENGIGRPSTYATILATLQSRDYTYKDEGKFHPTALGRLVTDLLTKSFDDIIDEKYTASLEAQLDEIEEGQLDWIDALRQFARKFDKDLERARKQMVSVKGAGLATQEKCDKCGGDMVIKFGRFGEFLACSNYPECKNTREMAKAGEPDAASIPPCERCGKEMVLKRGRFGPFLACSGYPDCRNIRKVGKAAVPPKPTGVRCPRCAKGEVLERKSRRGKTFYGCNRYPDCDFALWNRPLPESCPRCGAPYVLEKTTKRDGTVVFCDREECDFKEPREAPAPYPGEPLPAVS